MCNTVSLSQAHLGLFITEHILIIHRQLCASPTLVPEQVVTMSVHTCVWKFLFLLQKTHSP